MALGFIDGFDHYASADILAKWTGNFSAAPTAVTSTLYARGTGQGIAFNTTSSGRGVYKTVWPSGSATVTTGCALYFTANPANAVILAFVDAASEQCSVRGDGAGKLTVQRGATVLATSTNSITLNVWHYLEFQVIISTTVGRYELRVDGTSTNWVPQSAANKNTQSTGNAFATGIAIAQPTSTVLQTYFDDIYGLDNSGSTNTTFLGDCKVATLRPQAPGNYSQWTANGGANFGNVNDDPYYDADTSFNQSATANQIDSFVFDDIPAATGSVFGIQHVLWAKKDAGAARTFAAFQRSSSTDYVGTTQNAATSYAMYLDLKEQNPDTSAAWTVAGINAAELGYKILS